MANIRISMVRNTDDFIDKQLISSRFLSPDDCEGLGMLMYEAYKGTVDYSGETSQEAIKEMEKTFEGKYGRVLWDISLLKEQEGRPVGATIVTEYGDDDIPLIAFTFTHPGLKRTGMATRMIKDILGEAGRKGISKIRLFVNPNNTPAVSLYKKLGFVDEKDP